ncbi:MAG: hypothetical protein MUP27_09165 [Desulfobacterales bacterium]|nr:hypothetical protein [Desulfobacterales bacterium]
MIKGGNFVRGRLVLSLNKNPETPCMIYLHQQGERASATYDCVMDNGEIEGIELTKQEIHWLEGYCKQAEEWFDQYRVVEN